MWVLALLTAACGLLAAWGLVGVFRGGGLRGRVRRLAVAAAAGGLGVLLGSLLVILQALRAFTGETLVARVTTHRLSPETFTLLYAPVSASGAVAVTQVQLRGDQWSINGGIIKWHPWLTGLGVHSYHKPWWLTGQFSDPKRRQWELPSFHPLHGASETGWRLAYQAVRWLPFIDAVYGSSAWVFVESEAIHDVYVSPTGYLIKRLRQ